MTEKKKILIDCDAGTDDAEAILMALSCPDVDVVAITTVCGKTGAVQVARNVLRLLHVADRMDIPVHVGCTKPLLGDEKQRNGYHGNDGFGDVPDDAAPTDSHIKSKKGVQTILNYIDKYSGELTLICLGPLTNIAMATRLDPNVGQRVKECFVAGGNYHGKGNVTPAAEFNFYWDPEAAYVVLNQLACHVILLPWETCLDHSLDWELIENLRGVVGKKAELLKLTGEHSFKVLKKQTKLQYFGFIVPAEQICMAMFLCPAVIKSCVNVYATVELHGRYTTGEMVVDWRGLYDRETNVTMVMAIHDECFRRLLYQASDATSPE